MNADDRAMLTVNVTRTPTTESELAPFKVVTRTTMPQYQKDSYEVCRNAGDFQWLHDVLVDTCPERVVPPLRSTISLDGETGVIIVMVDIINGVVCYSYCI